MKKKLLLKKLVKISVLSGIAFFACDQSKVRIDEAYRNLEKANFDAALYSFHKLYKEKPQNPRVLAGLGILLSLKHISIFAAIDILKTSLKIKADAEVRRQLAMIYIAMGQTKRIMDLTRSDNLSVEEAFTPSLIQLHRAASCLEKPSSAKLKRLETAPQQEDSPFYYFLCELSLKKKPKDSIALLKSYYAIQNHKMRCEALSLCFIIENILPPDFLQKEKAICLKKSLALVALKRESLQLGSGEDLNMSRVETDFQKNRPGSLIQTPLLLLTQVQKA